MIKWDFSNFTTEELEKFLDHYKEGQELGVPARNDQYPQDLQAEISHRESKYNYVIIFAATNNDTHETMVMTILVHEIPTNIKERVKKTYDGVWEPDLDSIDVCKIEYITSTIKEIA
jgi:hypothetical protein